MLLGNYSVLSKHPGRDRGGGLSGLGCNRSDWNKNSPARAAYAGADWDAKSAVPEGCLPPYAWILPITAGGMSSHGLVGGTGTATGSAAAGWGLRAALSGLGAVRPTTRCSLIVGCKADLAGQGLVSLATLIGYADLTLVGGTLTGEGAVVATLDALGHLKADLEGLCNLTGSELTAIGHMVANVTPFTDLSPQNLAASVWSVLAAASNEPGTMGEKVNAAGTAGDPWTAELPAEYVDGTAGYIIAAIGTMLDDETIEDGLTMRQALRLIAAAVGGKVSGAAGPVVTFRSAVADDADRIVATVDEDGNRTDIVTVL